MSSPRPLTAPTGADLISSNPGRGSLRGEDLKGRSRKGDGLAGPEHPFSLLLAKITPGEEQLDLPTCY